MMIEEEKTKDWVSKVYNDRETSFRVGHYLKMHVSKDGDVTLRLLNFGNSYPNYEMVIGYGKGIEYLERLATFSVLLFTEQIL
jgi:hypothetical protein